MAAPDWYQWHLRYDDPASDLSRRLEAVQGRVGETLDRCPAGPVRAVSICAGQGRDLLGVLAHHRRAGDVVARLVELDARNADMAAAAVRQAGLDRVEVVVGDASRPAVYDGAVPADLVLACGVLGHVADDEVPSAIASLSTLCAAGATVVWTRGGELRAAVRRWFEEAGFDELGYDEGGPGAPWGVGAARLTAEPPPPLEPGARLFTFHDVRPAPAGRP